MLPQFLSFIVIFQANQLPRSQLSEHPLSQNRHYKATDGHARNRKTGKISLAVRPARINNKASKKVKAKSSKGDTKPGAEKSVKITAKTQKGTNGKGSGKIGRGKLPRKEAEHSSRRGKRGTVSPKKDHSTGQDSKGSSSKAKTSSSKTKGGPESGRGSVAKAKTKNRQPKTTKRAAAGENDYVSSVNVNADAEYGGYATATAYSSDQGNWNSAVAGKIDPQQVAAVSEAIEYEAGGEDDHRRTETTCRA